jgi:hypothetical protein
MVFSPRPVGMRVLTLAGGLCLMSCLRCLDLWHLRRFNVMHVARFMEDMPRTTSKGIRVVSTVLLDD